MLSDLLRALALMLVLEGLLLFAAPDRFLVVADRLRQLDARQLRMGGLIALIIGLLVLQLVRWLL